MIYLCFLLNAFYVVGTLLLHALLHFFTDIPWSIFRVWSKIVWLIKLTFLSGVLFIFAVNV